MAKGKKYKAQHYLPQSYMRPWIDPDIAPGSKLDPYVWVFERDGTGPRRKSPRNLFQETDFYAMTLPNGERSLYLEHGLGELEDRFTRIRNLKFSRRTWPTAEELAWLLAFVVAARCRTRAFRDHHREQWGRLRRRAEAMMLDHTGTTEAPIQFQPEGQEITLDEIRRFEDYPIHLLLPRSLEHHLPVLSRMSVGVLCTEDPVGFVTSDQPCHWFDPGAHRLPPIWRAPTLGAGGIEVTMPLTPGMCLYISHHAEFQGFTDVPQRVVDELNWRRIRSAYRHFISRRAEARQEWFAQREMPPDAWERVTGAVAGDAFPVA